ncbi:MAG: NUMOD3 domain-containing DNA-binding protein, partial [Nanoarchaeota archaeon]
IYKATLKLDGRKYYGQTIRPLEERVKQHTKRKGNQKSRFFNAINKYGIENFIFEIIEECNSIEELNNREKYWITEDKTQDEKFGFNITAGGDDNPMNYPELRKKVAFSKMGEKNPNFGRHYSRDERDRMSKLMSGNNNPFYGKTHNNNTKIKIMKSHIKIKLSKLDILNIIEKLKNGDNGRKLAREYKVHPMIISYIKNKNMFWVNWVLREIEQDQKYLQGEGLRLCFGCGSSCGCGSSFST